MRRLTSNILVASISVLVLLLMQRVLNTLGSSSLVGKLYTTYFRAAHSGMSRHTAFKEGEGVFNHGAFTVQAIPVLDDNYAYVSRQRSVHMAAVLALPDRTADTRTSACQPPVPRYSCW